VARRPGILSLPGKTLLELCNTPYNRDIFISSPRG